MEYRIIKSPSKGTIDILKHRSGRKTEENMLFDSVGLLQGKMIDMIFAADIAEKAVGVFVEDIKGSCPQNMILLAIYGDTSSVESAISEIKEKLKERNQIC